MTVSTKYFNGPRLYGYVAYPDRQARSGVLILPTIFGVNDFARGYANILATEGFLAAVWDISSGLPLVAEYQECIRRARTLTDRGVAGMLSAWIDWLLVDGRVMSIGVLGFCIGGRFALLQAAEDRRVRACAMAYPSIESPRLANQERDALELASAITCPVHLIEAGKDHVTSAATYGVLKDALNSRVVPTSVQLYPEAEHGFMHRDKPEANRTATAMASPQGIAFLKACLE